MSYFSNCRKSRPHFVAVSGQQSAVSSPTLTIPPSAQFRSAPFMGRRGIRRFLEKNVPRTPRQQSFSDYLRGSSPVCHSRVGGNPVRRRGMDSCLRRNDSKRNRWVGIIYPGNRLSDFRAGSKEQSAKGEALKRRMLRRLGGLKTWRSGR